MKTSRNSRRRSIETRWDRKAAWQRLLGVVCAKLRFSAVILSFCAGLPLQIAEGQLVRGELIDSTPQSNSLANGDLLAKSIPTHAPAGNAAEVPEGYHRMPVNGMHSGPQQRRETPLARGAFEQLQSQSNSTPTTEWTAKPASTNASTDIAPAPETANGYLCVGFDKLSAFPMKMNWWVNPTNSRNDKLEMVGQIPDAIRSLDKKAVAVRGFMMPLKLNAGLVTEFFLMRNRNSCCYGKPLQINELIYVRMEGAGVKSLMDRLLTVYGTLQVGEKLSDGNIISLYRLDGKEMEPFYTQ